VAAYNKRKQSDLVKVASMRFVLLISLLFPFVVGATDVMPNEGNLVYTPKLNEVLELKIWAKNTSNVSGFATIEFTVVKSGKVEDVNVIDAYPVSLGYDSVEAIKLWLFTPATVNGEVVKVTNKATFHFQQK
jgi:TonB family protein